MTDALRVPDSIRGHLLSSGVARLEGAFSPGLARAVHGAQQGDVLEEAWRHSPEGQRLLGELVAIAQTLFDNVVVFPWRYEKSPGKGNMGRNLGCWHRPPWPERIDQSMDRERFTFSCIALLSDLQHRRQGPYEVALETHRVRDDDATTRPLAWRFRHMPVRGGAAPRRVTLWGRAGDVWLVADRCLRRRRASLVPGRRTPVTVHDLIEVRVRTDVSHPA